jgi:hypothetical protein
MYTLKHEGKIMIKLSCGNLVKMADAETILKSGVNQDLVKYIIKSERIKKESSAKELDEWIKYAEKLEQKLEKMGVSVAS